jgi:predicted dehydrogenase
MESVDLALIGHGAWGEKIARTLPRVARARLGAVCDPSDLARARARETAPGARLSARMDDLLSQGDARAVIIATPPATHAALALAAMESGLDVMVEKPMTLCLATARRLERAARERGRVLMVGHILEYHPAVVELARRLAAGDLGSVELVVSERLSAGANRRENAWWSLGPHDVSVARSLTGSGPRRVQVTGWSADDRDGADVVAARVELSGGAVLLAHVSQVNPEKVRRTVVVASDGLAVFDDLRTDQRLTFYDAATIGRARLDELRGLGREYSPARGSARDPLNGVAPSRWLPAKGGHRIEVAGRPPLELETEHFVSGVLGAESVRTDASVGREVVAALEAGQRSLERGTVEVVARD